jgi:hypothetical protein
MASTIRGVRLEHDTVFLNNLRFPSQLRSEIVVDALLALAQDRGATTEARLFAQLALLEQLGRDLVFDMSVGWQELLGGTGGPVCRMAFITAGAEEPVSREVFRRILVLFRQMREDAAAPAALQRVAACIDSGFNELPADPASLDLIYLCNDRFKFINRGGREATIEYQVEDGERTKLQIGGKAEVIVRVLGDGNVALILNDRILKKVERTHCKK